MNAPRKRLRERLRRAERPAAAVAPASAVTTAVNQIPVEIAPNDPLLAYLQSAGGPVDVDTLELDSPAVRDLREAGVKLAVPLISQGELIGVLNLGARLSEQEYSSDDRRLLTQLAGQAAPALRVGQLVREQEAEAITRQRFEQELEVARLIQSHFLPKTLPDLPGWTIAACYRPAREVGGDFYDVIPLPDGRYGFVVGDVTDKGVPAALVMSATRSLLRAAAQRLVEPGEVLERVNEQLCPDMPEKMFVTCLYGVLHPGTGHLRFANAGHDLPYVKTAEGVVELRARGMPLGLMTGMPYEEKEIVLAPGDSVLLHSDGVVEAHDPDRNMFGFPLLMKTVGDSPGGQALIDRVLRDLDEFTGPGAVQEDDITMLTLERASQVAADAVQEPCLLGDLTVPSAPGNERRAIDLVVEVLTAAGALPTRVERLRTAIGEATMNAMEHGNRYRDDLDVRIRVLRDGDLLRVQVIDHGEAGEPAAPETPDIELKLEGLQSPRGWGLFLIKEMVDEVHVTSQDGLHTLELVLRIGGEQQ